MIILEDLMNIMWNDPAVKVKLYRARHKLTGEYLSQNYAKTGMKTKIY